ncbi:uncharacterized protein BXZ73DRAFT_81600 [Epithele typhae]|uniref:uncharacterized protein n=1 Tax=Epithele typhae TaxID=378194 RepID=UPI002007BDEE|nr:uncharacterized protein BXZ73DRAFT_81600 [Epithele typhae]KAH9914622.1 hypothetical protein BXZ73DRAFT_81600 [Epithele typhae]
MESAAPPFPELVSRIIIISTLLHHATVPAATASPSPISSFSSSTASSPRLSEDQIRLLDVWNALAFLLGPGDTNDRVAHKVVAVTGNMAQGVINTFLVSRNTDSREDAVSPRVFSSRDTKPGWDILSRSFVSIQRGDLDFETHIQDVLHVIRYFSAPPEDRKVALSNQCLFTFIVGRSYSKILSRIENGDRLWMAKSADAKSEGEEFAQGGDGAQMEMDKKGTPKKDKSKKGKQVERAQPVQEGDTSKQGTQSKLRKDAPKGKGKLAEQAKGEQAEPADLNTNHPTTHVYHILCSTPPTCIPPGRSFSFPSNMKPDLEKAGLTPTDSNPSGSELTYSVTNENASQWAKVVMDSVGHMRGILNDLHKDRSLSGFALSDKYKSLFNAMHVLGQVLACRYVVEALLSPEVVTVLRAMREHAFKVRRQKCEVEEIMMNRVTEDTTNSTGATRQNVADAVGIGSAATDDEFGLVVEVFADPDESPGDQFIRHLKTLIIPLTITEIMFGFAKQKESQTMKDPVEVNAVYVKNVPLKFELPQHPDLLGELEELWKKSFATRQARLPDHHTSPGDFPFTLEQLWKDGSARAKVHAEALLMAYALLVHGGELSQKAHDLIHSVLTVSDSAR